MMRRYAHVRRQPEREEREEEVNEGRAALFGRSSSIP